MEEETARRMCSLIAGVICSDGKMSADEQSFLKRVMSESGLETDTALMPVYGDDVAEELAQLPEAIRGETLQLVILAAAADGQIHPHERQIVDTIAQQLGVSEEEVVERFKKVLPA